VKKKGEYLMLEKDIIKNDLVLIYNATGAKSLKNAIIIAKHSQVDEIKTIGFNLAIVYRKSLGGKLPFNLSTLYFGITT